MATICPRDGRHDGARGHLRTTPIARPWATEAVTPAGDFPGAPIERHGGSSSRTTSGICRCTSTNGTFGSTATPCSLNATTGHSSRVFANRSQGRTCPCRSSNDDATALIVCRSLSVRPFINAQNNPYLGRYRAYIRGSTSSARGPCSTCPNGTGRGRS